MKHFRLLIVLGLLGVPQFAQEKQPDMEAMMYWSGAVLGSHFARTNPYFLETPETAGRPEAERRIPAAGWQTAKPVVESDGNRLLFENPASL